MDESLEWVILTPLAGILGGMLWVIWNHYWGTDDCE